MLRWFSLRPLLHTGLQQKAPTAIGSMSWMQWICKFNKLIPRLALKLRKKINKTKICIKILKLHNEYAMFYPSHIYIYMHP